LRIRTASAVLFSLIPVAMGASSALAANPGGVSATPPASPAPSGSSTRAPKPPPGAAPVAARTRDVAYHGPVYEKTTTGQVVPYLPVTEAAPESSVTGGSAVGVIASTKPNLLVPGSLARYVEGLAAAPMNAPAAVQAMIWAANQLIGLPYIYGGGHASFSSPGYDCSGTVSFALHGASLLKVPEDSSELEGFGAAGEGRWVTIFSNPGHAYMTVAGLRLDTSAADDPSNEQGPRWRPLRAGNGGYVIRHPVGF
jgi:cell wall-associated NlpC family hydrolase